METGTHKTCAHVNEECDEQMAEAEIISWHENDSNFNRNMHTENANPEPSSAYLLWE